MKKCTTYTIGKTTIKKEPNYDDFFLSDYLGKFTDDIGPGVYVRSEHEFYEKLPAEMERDTDGTFIGKGEPEYRTYSREYNGIAPCNHIPFNPKNWSHVSRKDKSEVIKKYGSLKNASYAYAKEDCERLEALNNGDWVFVTVIVETKIITDTGMSDRVWNTLSGVESDSGKEYFGEIISDLKAENKTELLKMGFSESEIAASLDNAEEVD
ncbi:MAG: hypothetical protein PHT77_05435 [Bacteroidales bacterium]|nr:hypothetical protein [Bacteroidales bacterium]